MVQGLAFLSKKSWHTKNFANQEKVWLAEERKRAEEQKTQELAKQIQQEKEQDELEAMTGKKTTRRDRGIDWMYEGYNPESQIAQEDAKKQAEEYLMGKEFVPAGPVKGDLNAESTTEGVHAVVAATESSSKPAAAAAATENTTSEAAAPWHEPSVHDRNEAFRMRHEDPMFAVAQRAREQEQKYNKKKELYERVVGGVAVDAKEEKHERETKKKREERRARKRERKEEKRKHRKKHRRDDRYRDDSGVDTEESDRGRARNRRRRSYSRSRSRSRSPSYDNNKRSYRRSDRRYRRSVSSSRSRSPSYDRHRCQHRSPSWDSRDRRHGSDRPRNDRYDNYDNGHHHRSEQSHHKSRQTSRRPHDNGKRPPQSLGAYERDHDYKRARSPPRQSSPLEETSRKKEGYGLQGGSSNNNPLRGKLGPATELLEQKRQKREEERRRIRETASSRRHRSADERAEALRAMERDAQRREESRASAGIPHEDDDDGSSVPSGSQGDASFLEDARKRAHGISGDQSMAERLQQNRNTNQMLNDAFL